MTSAAGEEAEATTRSSELPIAEVAELTGLSKDTLRYYERAGLIEALGRSSGGQRRYASSDVDWLRFLLRLRATGMPIAAMRQFAELRRAGSAGVAGRIALLSEHRDVVRQQVADLKGHLDALDTKLDHYHRLLDEQPEGATEGEVSDRERVHSYALSWNLTPPTDALSSPTPVACARCPGAPIAEPLPERRFLLVRESGRARAVRKGFQLPESAPNAANPDVVVDAAHAKLWWTGTAGSRS